MMSDYTWHSVTGEGIDNVRRFSEVLDQDGLVDKAAKTLLFRYKHVSGEMESQTFLRGIEANSDQGKMMLENEFVWFDSWSRPWPCKFSEDHGYVRFGPEVVELGQYL
jgi:hypothetical protein